MKEKGKLLGELILTFPDVFNTILSNAALIANDLREDYLTHTNSFLEYLKKCFEKTGGLSKSVCNMEDGTNVVVERILLSLSGKKIGALDGGLGIGLMGSVSPFLMRAIVFSVVIGKKGPDREKFTPSRFLINRLKGGALGASESEIGALLLLFELSTALQAISEEDYEIFLLHGPLVRSLGQYSTYTFDLSDYAQVMGGKIFKEFEEYYNNFEKTYPDIGLPKKDHNYFIAASFLINRIFEVSQKKRILIAGVTERSSSTENIQTTLFQNIDLLDTQLKKWIESVVGKKVPTGSNSEKAKYLKVVLDKLGYTDVVILGALLKIGNYTKFKEARANKRQSENHDMGLDTGLIGRLSPLTDLLPSSRYAYFRTSFMNRPFKMEIPGWLSDKEEQRIVEAIFAFSQFLPRYAFPVNLDIVDKVAKVSQKITDVMTALVRKEIFEGLLSSGKPLRSLPIQVLEKQTRDWDLRPKAEPNIVKTHVDRIDF